MRRFIVITALLVAGCGGNPVGPGGESELLEWTVDGQTYRASENGRGALRSGSTVSATGSDCGRGAVMNIMIPNATATGTYTVNRALGGSVQFTPDARTGTAAGENWEAPGIPRVVNNQIVADGTGTVSLTRITNDWVSGTFSGDLMPSPQNRDTSRKRVEGRFELSFRERTIC